MIASYPNLRNLRGQIQANRCLSGKVGTTFSVRLGLGAAGEGWQFGFGEAHAFGQDNAEAVEEGGLSVIGLGDATQADSAMGRGRQHDIVRLNARELFENGARRVSEAGTLLPHLQALPQHEGEEADENVRLNAVLALMPDRPYLELVFLNAECGLGLGELDVGLPQLLIAPITDVGAQQIGALRERGPVVEGGVVSHADAETCRAAVRLQRNGKACRGTLVLLRMRPICRFTFAGSSGFFARTTRAARRCSAASMRALNLSCIAFSLLRRSAERHRITVSLVSGWRVSLTSTPSWTMRQPSARASSTPKLLSSVLGAAMM